MFFTSQVCLVNKTGKKMEETSIEFFLGQFKKCHSYSAKNQLSLEQKKINLICTNI